MVHETFLSGKVGLCVIIHKQMCTQENSLYNSFKQNSASMMLETAAKNWLTQSGHKISARIQTNPGKL